MHPDAADDDDDGLKATLVRTSGPAGLDAGATLRLQGGLQGGGLGGIVGAPMPVRDTELAVRGSASTPSARLVEAATEAALDDASRYVVAGILGEGGMGEVRLCHDRRIGRDVAMKIAKSSEGSHPDLVARFLREVRVQGQLEHPGVVPVYDLGADPEGRAVFTMKRVRGKTLEEVVTGLRSGDAALVARWSRRQLLAAFTRACLTVAFAHSRGVVHRDLKPANIMIGDFGEVYVLDWGIARIATETEDGAAGEEPLRDDPAIGRTEAGAMLGTPGYMAPEQVRGELEVVGPASDVYALGAVLYELLALEPLHEGARTGDLLISTVRGVDGRPSTRARGEPVAPELDAICARATALEPGSRFASARALSDAVDAFLDGERDGERRRELAGEHVKAARDALASAEVSAPGVAMRELARALALEPTHAEALGTLRTMVLDADDRLPPEAEEELARINVKDRAKSALRVGFATFGSLIAMPLFALMGVRRPWLFAGLTALVLAKMGYGLWMGWSGRAEPRFMRWFIFLAFGVNATMAVEFGPWLVGPMLVVMTTAMFLVSLRPNRQTRHLIFSSGVLAVVVPAALDGWLTRSTLYAGNEIRILPNLTDFPETPTRIALLFATVALVITTNVLVGEAAARIVGLERRIFGQAWRLGHLLPEDVARPPASTSPLATSAFRDSRPSCSLERPRASAAGTSTRPPA